MKIADVIKYEGDNKTLIYKHESEDFNKFSQLIVHQTQEAIFFMNGLALDTFGPGRHTLNTENIPLLTKALNRLTDDENPFHCEVYFINKTEQMAIKWGTPEQFTINEDINGELVPFKIGARGEMSIKVEDSRKLLLKLVGTETGLSQDKMMDYFFSIVVSQVKANISKTMREQKISIFNVDENLIALGDGLKPLVAKEFEEYGISVEKFIVVSIKKPEGEASYESYRQFKTKKAIDMQALQLEQEMLNIEKQGEIQRSVLESQGRAISRQQEGYTYQQERSFDVAGLVAANEGVGQYSNLGIGFGVMAGVGNSIGGQVASMATNAMNGMNSTTIPAPSSEVVCNKCNNVLPAGAMFCFKCGEKVQPQGTVECSKCKKHTPAGAFCIFCGHGFKNNNCAKCGAELMDGAAFCLKCGEKID